MCNVQGIRYDTHIYIRQTAWAGQQIVFVLNSMSRTNEIIIIVYLLRQS